MSRRARPFNLLRTYALIALLVMALAGLGLSLLVDSQLSTSLLALGEGRNQAVARMLEVARGTAGSGEWRALEPVLDGSGVVALRIYDADGRVRYATHTDGIGRFDDDEAALSTALRAALAGQVTSRFEHRALPETGEGVAHEIDLIVSHIPLGQGPGGRADNGVLGLYLDVSDEVADNRAALTRLVYGALAIMLAVYLLLFGLVRRAQLLITAQQQELIEQATRDPLTGLPNRAAFTENLQHAINRAQRLGQQVGLIHLDINDFKSVNELHGQHTGDALLRTLAARMRSVVRDYNMLARVGVDEFTLTVGGIDVPDDLESLAQRLCEQVHAPVELGDITLHTSASIGIAFYPGDATDCDTLLRAADTATQRAKADPGCSHQFFTAQMGKQTQDRGTRIRELEAALQNEEFELFYQPKVDATSGTVVGAEALLRWLHPQRGRVSPLDFIPLLEETGLILPVGEWVIREACRAQRHWLAEGLDVVPVAVNVSATQFHQQGFATLVASLVDEAGIDASLLEIEMTESCLMEDVETNIKVLNALKEKGFRIAIDDFGTGYSSLNYLKKFPIDTLKIDRSFITNVHNRSENDNAAIVTAIMALSHSLHLAVVAEGVENAHELAYLHALGCRTIQGFLFSQPLEAREYEKLLRDSMILKRTMEAIREELAVGNG